MYGIFVAVLVLTPSVVTQYLELPYGTDGHTVGPDGPWWTLTMSVGSGPARNVSFHPLIGHSSSWWITNQACSPATSPCVDSSDNYINNGSQSFQANRHLLNTTSNYDSGTFGEANQVMNYTASGNWHYDTVSLNSSLNARNITQVVSGNTYVTYPGGTAYVPLSTMSLGIGSPTLIISTDGSTINQTLMSEAQRQGAVGTAAWSLHLGSAQYNQTGSIVLGGYDSSRIVGAPGVYNDNNFMIQGVSLKSYNDTNEQQISGIQSFNVSADSSVPYLYLPLSVCQAMANVLPVTYNQSLNLYLWNNNQTWDQGLVNRLSYFTFQFDLISIKVPLALLYLTLETPLATKPTRYFPCYSPKNNNEFILGRAFLQSAFISRINLGGVFLGQAPGPDMASGVQILTAQVGQQNLTFSEQDWTSTWAVLNGTQGNSTSSLSAGDIAGIVVGSVVFVTLLGILFIWLRRKKKRKESPPIEVPASPVQQTHKNRRKLLGRNAESENRKNRPIELDAGPDRQRHAASELSGTAVEPTTDQANIIGN